MTVQQLGKHKRLDTTSKTRLNLDQNISALPYRPGPQHAHYSSSLVDQHLYTQWHSQASTTSSSKTSNLTIDARAVAEHSPVPCSRLLRNEEIGVTDSYQQAIQSIQPSHRDQQRRRGSNASSEDNEDPAMVHMIQSLLADAKERRIERQRQMLQRFQKSDQEKENSSQHLNRPVQMPSLQKEDRSRANHLPSCSQTFEPGLKYFQTVDSQQLIYPTSPPCVKLERPESSAKAVKQKVQHIFTKKNVFPLSLQNRLARLNSAKPLDKEIKSQEYKNGEGFSSYRSG